MRRLLINRMGILMCAAFVALTSSGITLDLHLCKGSLHSFSLFGEATSCHSVMVETNCHRGSKRSCCSQQKVTKSAECTTGCCQKERVIFDIDEEYLVCPVQINESVPQETTGLNSSFIVADGNFFYVPVPIDYLNFKPPLLGRDLITRHQTYLL